MATEEEMLAGAEQLVRDLQHTVRSGITKTEKWRVQQLRALLKLVVENQDSLANAVFTDLGKPTHETVIYELLSLATSCKLAIKELKKWMAPEEVPVPPIALPGTAVVVPEPLGVALVIAPWNFPLLLAVDPLIGAISAGCAAVLKPSEVSPTVSSILAKLIPKYLDTDAIRVIEGGVPITTALLAQKWDKIFYTGNPIVGRIVMAAAAKHLTPVTLELGGKCPLYIDDSVDLKVSARRICQGKWGFSDGQACISPDYLLVQEHIVPNLVETLKATIVEFYGEDASTSPDLTRIVNANHFRRITRLLDDPRTTEKIVHGGERNEQSLFIAPTIVLDVPLDVPVMLEEIFGPILPIITVKGVDEAINIILDLSKPLALFVFSTDNAVQERFVTEISAGGVGINEIILHFTVPGIPFGGVGESGMGAYHGKYSFDTFSHKKGVYRKGMDGDAEGTFPPYTVARNNLIRSFLTEDLDES
ncbi:hypothetical protein CY35_17G094900 [Sphagnum magellanicum]|nr:hypothetical protein CY35_17G094900 [Sphagnum magellanicum]